MTEPPRVTRFARGIHVVLIGGLVVLAGDTALSMHRLKGVVEAAGLGAEVGTAAVTLFAVVFFYVLWLFIQTLRTTIRAWATAPSTEAVTPPTIEKTPRNLRGLLYAALTEPPKDVVTPAYRWGMLAIVLALLTVNTMVWLKHRLRSSDAGYVNFVVVLMLLMNHVSGCFHYPRTLTLALRVLAWGWTLLGCAYIYLLFE